MHRSICQAFKHEYPLITPSPPPRTAPPQIGISKTVIAFRRSADTRKGLCYMIHVKLMPGILLGLKASLDHRLCHRTHKGKRQLHMVFFCISCSDQRRYYNRGALTRAPLTLTQKKKSLAYKIAHTFTTQYCFGLISVTNLSLYTSTFLNRRMYESVPHKQMR